jgi:hypothetical protein
MPRRAKAKKRTKARKGAVGSEQYSPCPNPGCGSNKMFTSKQYTHHLTHHPSCRDFIKTIVRKNPPLQQLADKITATLIVNQEVLAAEPQDTELEFLLHDDDDGTIQDPQQPAFSPDNQSVIWST